MSQLALDLALRSGWASNDRDLISYGVIDVSKVVGLGPRLLQFKRELRLLLTDLELDTIWVEKPCGHSSAAVYLSRSFYAVVAMEAAARNLKLRDVAPNTLKKWATGNGRSDKIKMKERAAEEFAVMTPADYHEMSYDEADAICLLSYGEAHDAGAPAS